VKKEYCFGISTINQVENLLHHRKKLKTIIYIKNYLIKGFDIYWLTTFKKLIEKKYKNYDIKFYVNCGSDYGLCINLINYNIDYIKVRTNIKVYNKIKQIAKKNKVLLNPNFNIVDLSKIKNFEKKLIGLKF
tara:strand:+ start:63 stop:458 length:396 start_codon:yes stop_codon:yes gene_type:complete